MSKKVDRIHSELHYIAEQLWEYYEKKESFALFLGILKRKGKDWGYKMLSDMNDYKRRKNEQMPIKIFMAASKEQ